MQCVWTFLRASRLEEQQWYIRTQQILIKNAGIDYTAVKHLTRQRKYVSCNQMKNGHQPACLWLLQGLLLFTSLDTRLAVHKFPDNSLVSFYTRVGAQRLQSALQYLALCGFGRAQLKPYAISPVLFTWFPMGYTITRSITVLDHWAHSHEWQNLTIIFRILLQAKLTLPPKVT